MANHLKNIILPEPNKSVIDENICEEVIAFRTFLHHFCDILISEGNLYDKPKKYADEHRSALFYNFPFLDDER